MAKRKQDFAGKPITANTYTGDWVFKKFRPKGPNDSAGAWVTRDQAKELHQQDLERRSTIQARQAGGAVPPIPTTAQAATAAYGLTGPAFEAGRPTPTGTPLPGAHGPAFEAGRPVGAPAPDTSVPGWWIGQAYTNPNEQQQFANIANAILPTLSPEDQRTLGNYLATNYKDVYGGYSNVNFGAMTPTEITDQIRSQYLSPQRAQTALSLLERMKTASGSQNMGGGYDFLKNAVNLINQYAQGGALSREKYNQFSNAVSGLVQGAGQGMSQYANLAQLFNLPSFSAGPLVSNAPNTRLYS